MGFFPFRFSPSSDFSFKDFLTPDFRHRCFVVENKALNHFPRKSGAGKERSYVMGLMTMMKN